MHGIVDGNCGVEIDIHQLDLTRNRSAKCNFSSLTGIEPAIPVQRSNQLSYRGQLSSSNQLSYRETVVKL